MVVFSAGMFEMGDIDGFGSEKERPVHTVRIIRSFAIGRYKVTSAEYDRFATATGAQLPYDWSPSQLPVTVVSWNDAVAYAKWLSEQTGKRYRLPSEAEWEYAARSGGTKERWAGTSHRQELTEYAWYDNNSGGRIHPVRGKKPNGFGLYDMSGNVWELVADWWNDNYEGAPTDGSAWLQGSRHKTHVVRGGSWDSAPVRLRTAFRDWYDDGGYRTDLIVGFRLAQDVD
jgi:formylglycine-generating enzyme required for sulfatase activity